MYLVCFWLDFLSACLLHVPLKSWAIKGDEKADSCLPWLLYSGVLFENCEALEQDAQQSCRCPIPGSV